MQVGEGSVSMPKKTSDRHGMARLKLYYNQTLTNYPLGNSPFTLILKIIASFYFNWITKVSGGLDDFCSFFACPEFTFCFNYQGLTNKAEVENKIQLPL
ncbi:hypothetical protein [Paraburkholderia youngii]|uniref:hypothetical protein n=1 Tax=Paraburkholderia youngii TaxID=2782701 RepID=UPI003D21AB80